MTVAVGEQDAGGRAAVECLAATTCDRSCDRSQDAVAADLAGGVLGGSVVEEGVGRHDHAELALDSTTG